jgi:hypothetical protein
MAADAERGQPDVGSGTPEGPAAHHPDLGVLMISVLFHHGAGGAWREAHGPDRIVTLADRDAAQHGVAFSPGAAGTATAALSRKP